MSVCLCIYMLFLSKINQGCATAATQAERGDKGSWTPADLSDLSDFQGKMLRVGK